MTNLNPYAGCVLIDGLGPIRSRAQWIRTLMALPRMPSEILRMPRHARIHVLAQLRDLHIAREEELRVAESIDLAVRQSCRYRDPSASETWAQIAGHAVTHKTPRMPPQMVVVVGHSGTGKTETVLRVLDSYPAQVVRHASFPNLVGAHHQMVWISAEVPPNGRAEQLAVSLMTAWDEVMAKAVPGYIPRFEASLARERRNGMRMLEEWRQVATTHFLGAFHLDEVQNLFKLPSLKARAKKQRSMNGDDGADSPALSVVEDQMLRWILSLTNFWGMALLISGTPDGVQALMRRFATAQRAGSGGYHVMQPFGGVTDPEFAEFLLPQLLQFQCVKHPMLRSDALIDLLMELTAGVPRILIALWFAAQRVALEREDETFTVQDIRRAAGTYLAPLMPAVSALRSEDSRLMRRYEDLLPQGWDVWRELSRPI